MQHVAGSALHAVMRRDAAQAAAMAARMGVAAVYTQAADLLADPAVDAVYIATPVASHYEYTLAAAQAGKHVLVEKPMALSQAQCAAMIDGCAAAGVRLGVAYYRRFHPVVQHMRGLIAAGTLGTILSARAQYLTPRVPHAPDWRLDPAISSGGCLADVGSHRLDLLLALLGPARAVSACMATSAQQSVEFSASVLLHMQSGAHATCSIVWGSASYCDEFELIGSNGHVVASPLDLGQIAYWRGDSVELLDLPPAPPTHAGLVQDFVDAVRSGREVGVPGSVGMATSAVLEAAYTAARTSQMVLLA